MIADAITYPTGMSRKAGELLWRRRRLTLASGTTDIDTGLIQQTKDFADQSPDEPPLGVSAAVSPPAGTLPASRIQVVPMVPLAPWIDIVHGEPYLNTMTNTIHVSFTNNSKTPTDVNVFFWDPHTLLGPGQANTYNDVL